MWFVDLASHRSLWGAIRNHQLYILRMCCKGCVSFNFSIFNNLHDLPQKKFTRPCRKKKIIQFFYNLHDLPQEKLRAFTTKEITRLDSVFVHDLSFSPNRATIGKQLGSTVGFMAKLFIRVSHECPSMYNISRQRVVVLLNMNLLCGHALDVAPRKDFPRGICIVLAQVQIVSTGALCELAY